MTPEFEKAVGGMADIPQWFVWRLQWLPEEGKYDKVPWDGYRPMDAGDAANWLDYDTAVARCNEWKAMLVDGAPITYALGFRLTTGCGYFLYDFDKCVTNGVVNEMTQLQINAFPGAMLEFSSSRTGIHIIGMCSEIAHRSMYKPHGWEFYTENRGIAFGLDGQAWGSADTNCDAAVVPLVERWFKPLPLNEGGTRAAEWRGPEDDDELLRRIYKASPSANVAFAGVSSTQALMEGPCDQTSENDARLASTLAWWTGRDVERIERIMRRSKLYRDKWEQFRPQGGSLLRHTILNSCAVVDTCYQEPVRQDTALSLVGRSAPPSLVTQMVAVSVPQIGDVSMVTDYVDATIIDASEALQSQIASAGTVKDVYNLVPTIQAAGMPPMFQDQLISAFHRRLKVLNAITTIAKVRALLFPPVVSMAQSAAGLPDWAKDWCFVGNGNMFFNWTNSDMLDSFGFHATFGEHMPLTEQGKRQNAAEQCLHFYGMPKVSQVGYRPDRDRYYEWEGRKFVNTYTPASLPELAAYTDAGRAGIDAFTKLLYDMSGHRMDVYHQLLYWIAHNVQRPGHKIRWSPVIKGCQGDGKGVLVEVIKAVMGPRNVNITGNRALVADFTDWAAGGAVNVIEEIYLTGEKRYVTYNAMKEFITNKEVSINPKGRTTYKTWNCTNHIALTNKNDAIPLEYSDRRWFVVFTPWASLDEMYAYCKLTEDEWLARTKLIEWAFTNCAGELRNWLLTMPIPSEFRIDSINVLTAERGKMMSSSRDGAEIVAQGIIESGAVGVSAKVLSSAALISEMKLRALTEGFEVPKGLAVNHLMTRLGYSGIDKQVWWNGKLHTIWVKDGFIGGNDEIRATLDTTFASLPNAKV